MTFDDLKCTQYLQDSIERTNRQLLKALTPAMQASDLAKMSGVSDYAKISIAESKVYPMSQAIVGLSSKLTASIDFAEYNLKLNNLVSSGVHDAVAEIAKQLSAISVHSGYVEVPEALLPDDFDCEEVKSDNSNHTAVAPSLNETHIPNKTSVIGMKKIPIVPAIKLICTLITTLIAIVVYFQGDQQERIAIALEESNRIAVEKNKLLQNLIEDQNSNNQNPEHVQSLNNGIEYLYTILLQLEPSLADNSGVPDQPPHDDSDSPQSQADFLQVDTADEP